MSVDRETLLSIFHNRRKKTESFDFDNLWHYPIKCYLHSMVIEEIDKLVNSLRLNAKPLEKINRITNILSNYGFTRFESGTNRITFKNEYDDSFLLKVAIDQVGKEANLGEYWNQNALKPFCTKVFDITASNTIIMVERVMPILNRHSFQLVAGEIFDIMNSLFIGRFVMEDVGTKFFMNWGLRNGVSPVLLDFPYVYVLDGKKLVCKKCGGLIDYNIGMNSICCEICGSRYTAKSLGKTAGLITIQEGIEKGVGEMEQFTVFSEINGERFYGVEPDRKVVTKSSNNPTRNLNLDPMNGGDLKVWIVGRKPEPNKEEPVKTEVVSQVISTHQQENLVKKVKSIREDSKEESFQESDGNIIVEANTQAETEPTKKSEDITVVREFLDNVNENTIPFELWEDVECSIYQNGLLNYLLDKYRETVGEIVDEQGVKNVIIEWCEDHCIWNID